MPLMRGLLCDLLLQKHDLCASAPLRSLLSDLRGLNGSQCLTSWMRLLHPHFSRCTARLNQYRPKLHKLTSAITRPVHGEIIQAKVWTGSLNAALLSCPKQHHCYTIRLAAPIKETATRTHLWIRARVVFYRCEYRVLFYSYELRVAFIRNPCFILSCCILLIWNPCFILSIRARCFLLAQWRCKNSRSTVMSCFTTRLPPYSVISLFWDLFIVKSWIPVTLMTFLASMMRDMGWLY